MTNTSPALHKRIRLLEVLLALTVVLNLLDGVLTLIAVTAGWAVEANPLLSDVLARSPVQFMLTKVTLVGLGIYLLWRWRDRALAAAGTVCAFAVYCLILVHHVQGLSAPMHAALFVRSGIFAG